MRVALIFQWLRAARQDPERRETCLRYAKYVAIVQIGWVAVLLIDASVLTTFLMAAPLFVMEMAAPYFAERKMRTPWHAHHIAERYGLLAIIALGECLIGAIETLRAIVATHGWSVDAALVGLSGTGLAFAMWWIYFILPSGPALHVQRHRSWIFGYGHMPLFAAIAATGAGLHVAAYFIDHEAHIPAWAAVASIAIPIILFKASLTTIYSFMLGPDRELLWSSSLVVAGLAASIVMAAAGASVPLCMLEMMLVLGLSIAYDERRGHKGRAAALRRLENAAG
jgi:low temperature requirement protein LtrA